MRKTKGHVGVEAIAEICMEIIKHLKKEVGSSGKWMGGKNEGKSMWELHSVKYTMAHGWSNSGEAK